MLTRSTSFISKANLQHTTLSVFLLCGNAVFPFFKVTSLLFIPQKSLVTQLI